MSRDYSLEFFHVFVTLLLVECRIVVVAHVLAPPQLLKHLPLRGHAQHLSHAVGKQGSQRARQQRLPPLIHPALRLRLLPQRGGLLRAQALRHLSCSHVFHVRAFRLQRYIFSMRPAPRYTKYFSNIFSPGCKRGLIIERQAMDLS